MCSTVDNSLIKETSASVELSYIDDIGNNSRAEANSENMEAMFSGTDRIGSF